VEEERVGGMDKDGDVLPVGRKRKGARKKRSRGERERRLPKDLCTISKNCRDLSVKHKFLINLQP
jgi:hypothetical protein